MRRRLSFLSALLAAGMLICGSVNAQTQKFNLKDRTLRKVPRTSFVNKKMSDKTTYNKYPSKVSCYYLDGDSLTLGYFYLYEYVKPGLVSKNTYCEMRNGKTQYSTDYCKYNENDVKIEDIYGEALNDTTNIYLNKKITYVLDKIIKDFIIKEESFKNVNEAAGEPVWESKRVEEENIIRDEKNRILSVTEENVQGDGKRHISVKTTCEYEDGENPVIINKYTDDGGELRLKEENTNIVWGKCDNQITDFDDLADFITTPNTTDNRILSFKQRINRRDYYECYDYKLDYDEKNRTTKLEVKSFSEEGDVLYTMIYMIEYPDDFGSYIINSFEADDTNNDGVFSEDELKLSEKYSLIHDKQGNIIKDEYCESSDGDSLVISEGRMYSIVYDEMNRVSEVNYWYYDSESKEYIGKDVYEYDESDTGIASVNRENVNLKVNGYVVSFGSTDGRYMVSNADGKVVMAGSAADGWVSLEGLPSGLYIVKVNGCAVKVVR